MNLHEDDLLPEEPIERDPLDDLSDPENPEANAQPAAETDPTELVNQELNDLKDQLLRTMADFQNFRKRAQQDRQLTQKLATEDLVRDILPVLDNFERTIKAADQGASMAVLLDGVKMIHRQLLGALAQRNLEPIKTVGQPFDPEFHDALGTVDTTEFEEGVVAEELEPGYRMADRTIRPARVRVAKKP